MKEKVINAVYEKGSYVYWSLVILAAVMFLIAKEEAIAVVYIIGSILAYEQRGLAVKMMKSYIAKKNSGK